MTSSLRYNKGNNIFRSNNKNSNNEICKCSNNNNTIMKDSKLICKNKARFFKYNAVEVNCLLKKEGLSYVGYLTNQSPRIIFSGVLLNFFFIFRTIIDLQKSILIFLRAFHLFNFLK